MAAAQLMWTLTLSPSRQGGGEQNVARGAGAI